MKLYELNEQYKAVEEALVNEDGLLTDEQVKKELGKYFTEEQMLMPEPYFTITSGVIAVVRKAQKLIDDVKYQKEKAEIFQAVLKDIEGWYQTSAPIDELEESIVALQKEVLGG